MTDEWEVIALTTSRHTRGVNRGAGEYGRDTPRVINPAEVLRRRQVERRSPPPPSPLPTRPHPSTPLWFALALALNFPGLAQSRQQHPTDPQTIERGREVYDRWCGQCHGLRGAGDGPAADRVNPHPRDFTQGWYKLRTTPTGQLPTDQDLFRTITRGMPGTSMPGWANLSERDRWNLVTYLKAFSYGFEETREPITIPKPMPATRELLELGRQYYQDLGCWKCHGQQGRGDGPSAPTLEDNWGNPVRPANLSQPWEFRGGFTPGEIYRTLMTGLAGTPMPSYADIWEEPAQQDSMIWSVAHYTLTLAPERQPAVGVSLRIQYLDEPLPDAPDDPRWVELPFVEYPLVGQVIKKPRWFTPSLRFVESKGFYNENGVALLLQWDDPTPDSLLAEEEERYPDALAIQFPVQATAVGVRPSFLHGDADRAVNLWYWDRARGAMEQNSRGLGTEKAQPPASQQLRAAFSHQDGRYTLTVVRSLATDDTDIDVQFLAGEFSPIAFSGWDGSNGEYGSRLSLTGWYLMVLEGRPTPARLYIPPLLALAVLGIELVWLRRARRRARA